MCVLLITNLFWGVEPVYQVNHASLVAVVTPADLSKSAYNLCVIKIGGVFVLLCWLLWMLCWYRGLCHGARKILRLWWLICAISRCRDVALSTTRQHVATTRHRDNATMTRMTPIDFGVQRSRSQDMDNWNWFPDRNCFPFSLIFMKLSTQNLLILGSKGHRTWITKNDFRTTSALLFHLSSWDLVYKLPISQQWPLLGLGSKVKVTRYR